MIHGLYEEAQGFVLVRVDISWQFYNFKKIIPTPWCESRQFFP